MTICQAIAKTVKTLSENKFINNPRLDAEILLSHILKKTREFILTHPEHQLNYYQKTKLEKIIQERAGNKPIAYITGNKEFYGLNFKVNKRTLIPRPETELMIDKALCVSSENFLNIRDDLTIIDVGTGSGCIIIAMANKLVSAHPCPNFISFIATDISKPAMAVACQNAKKHNLNKKIKFLQGNLLEPVLKNKKFQSSDSNLLILANLPYLTPAQIKNSPTIHCEPKLALFAGADGLKYYRELLKQIKKFPVANHKIFILLEIDPGQSKTIERLIKKKLSLYSFQIKKDLAGYNRLVIIQAFS